MARLPHPSAATQHRKHQAALHVKAASPREALPAEETEPGKPDARSRRFHLLAATVLAAFCTCLYAWTADFPMVFDDHLYIRDNPLLKDAGSFSYPLHFTEFAGRTASKDIDPDVVTNFILRPAAYASFHLNFMLDGLNPRWFRALNIAIHAANSILIFALVASLLRQRRHSPPLPLNSTRFIPFSAAMLFAAHPLATESVTYIVQRFTSMSTLFYLLALWLYFSSLRTTSKAGTTAALRASSVVALVLGMLTKECVFTAPLVAVAIDHIANGARLRVAARRALPLLLCLPIIPTLVMLTSAARHHGEFSLTNALNIVNSSEAPVSHWHYFITQITVVAAYLRRMVWPADLNLDPDWPLYRSLLDAPVLTALAGLGGLLIAVGWMWRRHRHDVRCRLAFVFTLWFFVTVSVSSGLVPLPDLMAEHRSYLPSIGIFVLAAILLDGLRTSIPPHRFAGRLVPVATFACVGALAWANGARNEVWRTSESLWGDAVAKSPAKHRPWGSLGACYADSGRDNDAVECYRKALRLEPRDQNSMFNLSNSLLRLSQPQEALNTTIQLIDTNKQAATSPPVAYTLSLGLAGVGKFDEAIKVLLDLVATVPDHAQAHRMLGLLYLHARQPGPALKHLRQSALLQPPDARMEAAIKEAESSMMAPTGSPKTGTANASRE